MSSEINCHVAGTELTLRGDKTVFWPEEKLLIISDLHIGKVMHFRRAGFAVPLESAKNNLERLSFTLLNTDIKKVIFLGMNPGPFGMAQTGVPFGEIAMVKGPLGIDGKVRKPAVEHPKRPVTGLATERSADETAVDAFDGDRRLVARTIARAAITRSADVGLVGGFGGGSVPARVHALIGPPDSTMSIAVGTVAGALIATSAMAAGSVQMHHLAELIDHLCHF